jgi:hypothetical protein
VRRKPRVLIIPTGSELVDWRTTAPEDLKPGQVLETNAYVLEKIIEASGGVAVRHDRVLDDLDLIRQTVADAVAALRPDLGAAQLHKPLALLLFGMINWTHIWFDPNGPLLAHDVAEMAFQTFIGRS